MRSKLLLFLAISRIPSARSFYDVDSDQGCNWSTSMYICVSARFICGGYLASPELNRLNVTAYQVISHYEYVKLRYGDFLPRG
uniref:Secreted protein n=1 Tax=Bursaphelenchus xylophilus TaxID=6326 RepID=A0A1I7SPE5_BURXY